MYTFLQLDWYSHVHKGTYFSLNFRLWQFIDQILTVRKLTRLVNETYNLCHTSSSKQRVWFFNRNKVIQSSNCLMIKNIYVQTQHLKLLSYPPFHQPLHLHPHQSHVNSWDLHFD